MEKKPPKKFFLPTPQQILDFIAKTPTKVGKREIARAFHLKGQQRLWLKSLLKEMADEGLIQRGRKKQLSPKESLPHILVCRVEELNSSDGTFILTPVDSYNEERKIFLKQDRAVHLETGDRILVHTKLVSNEYYQARLIKKLRVIPHTIVGVIARHRNHYYIEPTGRRQQKELVSLESHPDLREGDVVIGELQQRQRPTERYAKIVKHLGHMNDPKTISFMAIYTHNIPYEFPEEVLKEAEKVKDYPLTLEKGRIDLRHISFVTIDGEDARDFDDAVWASFDPEKGWNLMVAIADVAYFVRPGSFLDQEAHKRGNSIYFPDSVVPMLPEALSNGVCSLKPNVDRASLVVSMWLDKKGRLKSYTFQRALIRSVARLTYNQVQKAFQGDKDSTTEPLMDSVINPLFEAYHVLKIAREFRGTLDLELEEHQIILDKHNHISEIIPRQRLDSHKLIEEFMILANVAAAQQLDQRQSPCIYRIHEPPREEKLTAFRETLKGLGIKFSIQKTVQPKMFLSLLNSVKGSPYQSLVHELTLRTQSQAVYHPNNVGHFGLSLEKYSHFTSPIRRYADVNIHRSLISALELGNDGLPKEVDFIEISTHVSSTERRADAAERETLERYKAIYLRDHTNTMFEGRINGVANFGLFITLLKIGSDGLIPLAFLPKDNYRYDEIKHQLIGQRTKKIFTLGDKVDVRLVNVDPITNSMTLEIVSDTTHELRKKPPYKSKSKKKPKAAAPKKK